MALKSKEEKTNEQVTFEDLMEDFEAEYTEEIEYTTISGKPQTNVQTFDKLSIYDFDIGEDITGKPEITHFKNDDRKYDSLRVRIINEDQFVDLYINIPKPDNKGFVKNIRKEFDFYRTAYDFIYSVLRYQDEANVVDENGEEKNLFKKVNILLFAKYVDQMEDIGVRLIEGNSDSDYDSWIIYKMEWRSIIWVK